MDDLLNQFKEARRAQQALYAKMEAQMRAATERGELWSYGRSPDWPDYAAATSAFHRAADRLADYLLGVETQ